MERRVNRTYILNGLIESSIFLLVLAQIAANGGSRDCYITSCSRGNDKSNTRTNGEIHDEGT